MFVREQYNTITSRIQEPRGFIQVLIGPRQVGKSTLIKQVLQSTNIPYLFRAADDTSGSNSSWISEQWSTARSRMQTQNLNEFLLVLDEVQKLDNWSETVKKEWDEDSFNDVNLKVILLGSSRLLLKKGLTESLLGRFELIRMGHWSFAEMQEAFGVTLDQYIYFGGYPGSARLVESETRWKRYVKDAIIEPALSKDVLLTSTIYKPALIKQLFELGCSYSSELLSLNKMLGQLQDAGNVTTLAGYLQILDECELLTGLHKYAYDKSRKYNSIPKYQVYNSALMTAYSEGTFKSERLDPRRWGRRVESAVGAHLISNADKQDYKVFYWRDASDEVDFVIARGDKSVGIEVKSGRRTTNKGLALFKEQFNPQYTLVVGSGGISIEEFLQTDVSKLL